MNSAENYVKSQSIKKAKEVKKNKMWLSILKMVNRVGLMIPVSVFFLFAGVLVYLLFYQFVVGVANVIDFIVAVMSVSVLIVSYVRGKLDERKQYVRSSLIYILLLTIGLIVFIVGAINIEDVGNVARVLSCVCLGITIGQEIIDIVKTEHKINVEEEHKQAQKIEMIEAKSITRI